MGLASSSFTFLLSLQSAFPSVFASHAIILSQEKPIVMPNSSAPFVNVAPAYVFFSVEKCARGTDYMKVYSTKIDLLRAVSHTVAVYDPEPHPKKKYSVRPQPTVYIMQIDHDRLSIRTVDGLPAHPPNLVAFASTSSDQTLTQSVGMDSRCENDLTHLQDDSSADNRPMQTTPTTPLSAAPSSQRLDVYINTGDQILAEKKNKDKKLNENRAKPTSFPIYSHEFRKNSVESSPAAPYFFPTRSYADKTVSDLMKELFGDEYKDEPSTPLEEATSCVSGLRAQEIEYNPIKPHEGNVAGNLVSALDKLDVRDPRD